VLEGSAMTPEAANTILSETVLSLRDAAKLLPSHRKRGRPVSISCLTRWVLKGKRTPHGIIKLEAVPLPGQCTTSNEALARFGAALAADRFNQPQPSRTPKARQRSSERAMKQLESNGCC